MVLASTLLFASLAGPQKCIEMTFDEVMTALEGFGSEQTKKTYIRHGAKEPLFGVKAGDLKKIQKKVKKDHELSLKLWKTGNSDAMYLAGLIADETQITKAHLQDWVKDAYWQYLNEYTVPWVAADSGNAWELALEWIDAPDEQTQAAGWGTLSSLMSVSADDDLDLKVLESLLDRVGKEIHGAANRTRYTMNGFVIAAGSFAVPLTKKAQAVADIIGKVSVDMNGTACKVPLATQYIQKVLDNGRHGNKKKVARC